MHGTSRAIGCFGFLVTVILASDVEGACPVPPCAACFHVADELLLSDGTADVTKIDLVGRLGGDSYSTVRDRFDMPKPNPKR